MAMAEQIEQKYDIFNFIHDLSKELIEIPIMNLMKFFITNNNNFLCDMCFCVHTLCYLLYILSLL